MNDDLERMVMRAPRETKERIYQSLKAFFSMGGKLSLPSNDAMLNDLSDNETLYLTAICDALQQRGLGYSSPALLRKSRAYATFKGHKEAGIDKFFAREEFTRPQKLALLKLGIGLLIENLRYHRIPPTGGNVLMNFHKLPALIDRELPGYAERRILKSIFRKRQGSGE